MLALAGRLHSILELTRVADFLAPLALRLYLAPVFWMAGSRKLADIDSTAEWLGNPDWGLGLPFPTLMAWLAGLTEAAGSVCYALGAAVRWVSIPLMITMVIAAVTVHWENGWLAIAEAEGVFATERTVAAVERLDQAKSILKQHGNYEELTEHGSFAVLNNGIEFAATYFIMCLALFFIGAGRYLSIDYAVRRWLDRRP